MRKLFLFFNLILACNLLLAQNQWINWNSANGGISFKNGTGTVFTGVPKNLQFPDYQGQRSYSYSDPKTGDIKFITDGRNIWNKQYRSVLYPPGDTLVSCDSDYYKVQIVPFTNDPDKFYLFHLYSARGVVSSRESGLPKGCNDPNLSALYYSVLEMNFPAATGRLLIKNQPLIKFPLDRVMLVKHANGKDTWVIGHPWDSAHYSAFLVTDEKIYPPVNTVIGPPAGQPSNNIRSSVAVSPDGKMLAASGSASYVELYDFNNSTGELSNYRTITLTKEYVTSLCFSPDNSKLYIAVSDTKVCDSYAKIYQVNFDESNLDKSRFEVKSYPARRLELGLAKDNHIWIKGATYPGIQGAFYDLIMYPNQPKNACAIKERHLLIGFQSFFPNIPNGTIQQAKETPVSKMNFPDTVITCLGVYCIKAAAGYEAYRWSNGDTTSSINVREPGMYKVLAGRKGFSKPDAYGYIYVKSSGGESFIAEDTFYCPKQPHLLVVPNHISSIKWSDGDSSRIKQVYGAGEYKLTAVNNNNGCRVWDSMCVSIHESPIADFGLDTTMCDRKQIVLKLKNFTDTSGSDNVKASNFLWQDGSKKASYTVTKPGTYWGQVSFDGCTVADTINIKYTPMPLIALNTDTAVCEGKSLTLAVPYLNTASYSWSTGNTDTSITVHQTGVYSVKATSGFCVESDSIAVLFKPAPYLSLGKDTSICKGSAYLLRPSDQSGYNFTWNTGDITPTLTVRSAGTYSVKAELNGCFAADTILVQELIAPSVKLRDTFVCSQSAIVLDAGAAPTDNIKWQDGSSSGNFTITNAGTYSVTLTNKCGTSFASIKVETRLCEVMMPTAFSPNGDNKNDYFRVKFPEIIRSLSLVVFNRFGQKVYESSDPYRGWDGRFQGNLQSMGTYVWKLNYTDVKETKHSLNGYVVLMR